MADGAASLYDRQCPSCPKCRSDQTVFVDDRFGTLTFFCGDCQHSWEVLASKLPPRRRKADDVA